MHHFYHFLQFFKDYVFNINPYMLKLQEFRNINILYYIKCLSHFIIQNHPFIGENIFLNTEFWAVLQGRILGKWTAYYVRHSVKYLTSTLKSNFSSCTAVFLLQCTKIMHFLLEESQCSRRYQIRKIASEEECRIFLNAQDWMHTMQLCTESVYSFLNLS